MHQNFGPNYSATHFSNWCKIGSVRKRTNNLFTTRVKVFYNLLLIIYVKTNLQQVTLSKENKTDTESSCQLFVLEG